MSPIAVTHSSAAMDVEEVQSISMVAMVGSAEKGKKTNTLREELLIEAMEGACNTVAAMDMETVGLRSPRSRAGSRRSAGNRKDSKSPRRPKVDNAEEGKAQRSSVKSPRKLRYDKIERQQDETQVMRRSCTIPADVERVVSPPRRSRSQVTDRGTSKGRNSVRVLPDREEVPDLALEAWRLSRIGVPDNVDRDGPFDLVARKGRKSSPVQKGEMQDAQDVEARLQDGKRGAAHRQAGRQQGRQNKRKIVVESTEQVHVHMDTETPIPVQMPASMPVPMSMPMQMQMQMAMPVCVPVPAPVPMVDPHQPTAPLLAHDPFDYEEIGRENNVGQLNDGYNFLVDILMWHNIPRSTLIFGVGSFCMLSSSYMRGVPCNMVTIMSYIGLLYLSGMFFVRNFLWRMQASGNSLSWSLSEEDAFEFIKRILPVVNAVLMKFSQLFGGDPGVTLKVAAVLWLLAQAGYWMSLSNLVRFAYFGAFVIPKCYICYSRQLNEHGQGIFNHVFTVWDSCSHKKAALVAAFLVVWNLSSLSARLWFGFILIVAMRHYQQTLRFDEGQQFARFLHR